MNICKKHLVWCEATAHHRRGWGMWIWTLLFFIEWFKVDTAEWLTLCSPDDEDAGVKVDNECAGVKVEDEDVGRAVLLWFRPEAARRGMNGVKAATELYCWNNMLRPSLEHTCCLRRIDVKFTRVHVPPQVDAGFHAAAPQHSDPLMLFSWFEWKYYCGCNPYFYTCYLSKVRQPHQSWLRKYVFFTVELRKLMFNV